MDTKIVEEIWKESPKSVEDLEKLSLYSILLALGGYISIGIGTLHFFFSTIETFEYSSIFHFLINIIFGFALLLSYHMINADTKRWALLAIVFSLTLIVLGDIVGQMAGFVGILGAILAILAELDESFDI